VQNVKCVTHVQALPEPAGASRPRMETKALRFMSHPECLDGFPWHRGRRRYIRQRAAIRPPELQRPVGPARDLEALLVHRAMMPGTE
jgi:hypothetical protein